MKKYLLFIMALCAGLNMSAQMATTMKQGLKGERLVSDDHRNICFRTLAKRMEADLNPATHQASAGYTMDVIKSSDFHGFTEAVGDVATTNETVLNTLPYFYNGNQTTPAWNMNVTTDTYYGNQSGDPVRYVDLTGYDQLRIYRSNNTGFRAFFYKADGSAGNNTYSNASSNVTWNSEGKYWAVDLSQVEKYNGKIYLIAIKSSSYNVSDEVQNITVCNMSQPTIAREANCTYTYDANSKVGTFSFANVRTGNAVVNLFYGLKGKLADYENFVIRTLNVSSPLNDQIVTIKEYNGDTHNSAQTHRYCLQFCDEYNNVLHDAYIYSEDMKVIPLREFFTDDEFNKINSVWLSTAGGDVSFSSTIQVAESYFISAFDLNKTSADYPLGEYYYDMDDQYIGNAYIHPSYFMLSNGVNFDTNTGEISMDENVYSYLDLTKAMYNNTDKCDFYVGEEKSAGAMIYGKFEWGNELNADLAGYDYLYVRFDKTKDAPVVNFNMAADVSSWKEISESNKSDYISNGVLSVADDGWKIDLNMFRKIYSDAKLSFIKAGDGTTLVTSALLEKVQKRGPASANTVDKTGRIQLSVPFAGFDMSDVTVVSMDNAEDGDVMGRWICGYLDYYRHWNVPEAHWNNNDKSNKTIFLAEENLNGHDIRTLYTSRYNGEFEPPVGDGTYEAYQQYKTKVNNMYWDTSNAEDRTKSMTIYDICITKNHVIARNGGNHTRLSKDIYNNPGACADITASYSGGGQTIYGDGGVAPTNYADLSKYYKMQIKGTPNQEYRILSNREVANGPLRETMVRLDANGLANVDIADIVKKDGKFNLNAIKTPWGASGEANIDYIKLYGEEDGVVELNSELFHTWIRDENTTVTREIGRRTGTDGDFENNIGGEIPAGGLVYGAGPEFYKENYAELTGYKTLRVYGSAGVAPRLIYNCARNKTDEGGYDFKEMRQTIGSEGYVDFDLRPFVFFHLNSIKNWGAAGTISKIELISDERVDYVLEGNGTLSRNATEAKADRDGGTNAIPNGSAAMDAINDVGARVIDARPRVNLSRMDLAYPANPNCLFLARKNLTRKQSDRVQFNTPYSEPYYANLVTVAGLLSDEYKIGEDGLEINNLHIFDGYPFSAPRKIKADSSVLTRKTTGGVVGTIILPFNSTDVKGTVYETREAVYAKYDSEDMGILENIDIKKGDHVLLFDNAGKQAKAYTPYLYVADETSDETLIYGNGDIEQTPEVGSEDAPAEYLTNNRPADEEDRHYLRGFMEPTHVENIYAYTSNGTLKRAANATLNPFRVMIQAPIGIEEDYLAHTDGGTVKMVLASSFNNDDPTAIESIERLNPETVVDVFSVNGMLIQRNVKVADAVNSLPKGVYVIGGKKIVK